MKSIFYFLRTVVAIVVVVVVHLTASAVLPPPWNGINVIFALVLFAMLASESGWLVWVGFFAHFFIELYAATPFGIILFSATMSLLVAYWLLQYLFVNKSWYSAGVISLATMTLYRTLSMVLLIILQFLPSGSTIPWRFFLVEYATEILLTSFLVTAGYGLLFTLSRRKDRAPRLNWIV